MPDPLIVTNSSELARFKVLADKFDKRVVRELRKSIRAIGDGAIKEVVATLRLPPPTDGGESVGARDALAEATRLTMSFSQRSAGAKITTSNARLPADQKGFAAAYNQPSFRHPVHGNKSAWVNQQGRPYFGSVIKPYLDTPEVKAEIVSVLDEAVKAIGGRGK